MDEYISRKDALSAQNKSMNLNEMRKRLERLPAADVRPVVKAHWYWDKDGMDWGIGSWRCSACHSRPETWWQGDSTSPRNKSGHYFCPNCGADMSSNDSNTRNE